MTLKPWPPKFDLDDPAATLLGASAVLFLLAAAVAVVGGLVILVWLAVAAVS